jgi:flagellar basal body P-ring formation protein FlgA
MLSFHRAEPMKSTLLTVLLITSPLVLAQQPAPARQDLGAVRQLVEQYLKTQTAGLTGKVGINVGKIDQRMNLAACPAPEAFQQPGARAWGKTTVGVRCAAPAAWTVYIQAQVSVVGEYVAAAVPLVQGKEIDKSQLAIVTGDIAALPNGVVTDIAQAVGRTSTVSLASGAPLRLDSAEARAIGTAADGQVVQARTPGGAIISGLARAGGQVEVAF